MKVLITGGSGFLGINLIRYLHSRDYQIVSLDIADFDYPDMNEKIEIIKGDIRDKEVVKKAVDSCSIVIHTAAALPLYSPEDIFSTDIDGTRNLIEASHSAGVKRFIHISSTAVYGIPDHHPLFEDDKLEGVGPYGKAKIKAEEEYDKFRVIQDKQYISDFDEELRKLIEENKGGKNGDL